MRAADDTMAAVTSAEKRASVRGALKEHVPELTDAQVAALEIGVWNWALDESARRDNLRVFDAQLSDDYCRRAAHCAANLSAGPLGNGNTWLLPLVLAGSVEPYAVPFMDAHALNAPLVGAFAAWKNDRDLSDRTSYLAVSTLFECPHCGKSRSTYRQLQTRSGDEGSTLFIHCLECGADWKDSD